MKFKRGVICDFFFFFLTERTEASLSFQDYFIHNDKSESISSPNFEM